MKAFVRPLIFLLILLHITETPVLGIVRILTYCYIGIGCWLIVDLLINQKLPFGGKELKVALVLLFIHALFLVEDVMFENLMFHQFIARALAPFVIFWLFLRFGNARSENGVFLTKSLGVFFLLSFSFLVFGRTLLGSSGFQSLRYHMYASYYNDVLAQYAMGSLSQLPALLFRAGLSPRTYLFGYQIAGGVTLLICLFFIDRGKWKMVWAISSLIGLAALVMTGERSTVPAVAGGLFVFYLCSGRIIKRRLFRGIVATIFIVVIVAGLVGNPFGTREGAGLKKKQAVAGTLFERYGGVGDEGARFQMQVAALMIALNNPLGVVRHGLKEGQWGQLARSAGYEQALPQDERRGEYAYVHNGYLRVVMYFGWIMLPFMVYVCVSLFRKIRYIQRSSGALTQVRKYGGALGAALAAVFIQPIFHNDSLFSGEKTCWLIFALLILWYRYARKEARHAEKEMPLSSTNGQPGLDGRALPAA